MTTKKVKVLEALEKTAKENHDSKTLQSIQNYKTKILDKKSDNKDIVSKKPSDELDTKTHKDDKPVDANDKPESKQVQEKSKHDMLDSQVMTQVLIDQLTLTKNEQLALKQEHIIGYSVDYSFEAKEINFEKSLFKCTETIPSYFTQELHAISVTLDSSYTNNPIRHTLNREMTITEVTNKVYNDKTLLVNLKFAPHGFDVKDLVGLADFDVSINPFPMLVMSDVSAQPLYDYSYLGNMVQKLILLYQSSNFIFRNLKWTTVANNLSNNRIGVFFDGKEAMEQGEPHILYITHDFPNEETNQALYNALLNDGGINVRTGRVQNTISKVNSVVYKYDAYIHTDQYVVRINNLNHQWLEANRLTANRYIRILSTFLENGAIIIDHTLQPFQTELSYVIELPMNDYKNYILSFYLFPHIQTSVLNFISKEIEALDIITAMSPIEYMRTNEMGKSDLTLIKQLFEAIKIVPTTNLVNMIMLEMLRTSYNFKISTDLQISGANIITHLMNIFCGATFFPYLFSRLAWYYYPILYNILSCLVNKEYSEYIAVNGRYCQRVNRGYVKVEVAEYGQAEFDRGILPSLMVIPGRELMRRIHNILKPVYYIVELDKREEANIPYITDDYRYSSSWPVGSLRGNAHRDDYTQRVRTMTTLLSYLIGKVTANENFAAKMVSLRSSSSSQTLSAFTNSVINLIQEGAEAFLRIAGPLSKRIMQMPFIPGTIIDIERVIHQGVDVPPSSNFIGVTAQRRQNGRMNYIRSGFSAKADTWTFNPMPFLNSTINLCLPNGRGVIIGTISDVRLNTYHIPQLNCFRLFKAFRSLLMESKTYLEYFFLFLGCINDNLNQDLTELIQQYLPRPRSKSIAAALLSFMSKLITTPLDEVLTIYSSHLGTTVLNDPRGINFSIGVLKRSLEAAYNQVDGTRIGDDFELEDELLKEKIDVFTKLLTSENVPNLQLGMGLAIGQFTSDFARYTDTAPDLPYINVYVHNQTFTLIRANSPDYPDMSHSQLQYTYTINGVVYHASNPREIQHLHTLEMSSPAVVTVPSYRTFIIEAINMHKIYVKFTDLHYKWSFKLIASSQNTGRLGDDELESIWKIKNDSDQLPLVTFYDSRGLFTPNVLTIYNGLIRWILPLQAPVDMIIASGLFDLNRANQPYIKRNFFTYNDDNIEDTIGDFPSIDHKAHVITDAVLLDLPDVEVTHVDSLV